MLLALDVGNSNIKVGLFDGREMIASWRTPTSLDKSCDEYGILFMRFLSSQHFTPAGINGVVISSVSPELNDTLDRMARTRLLKMPMYVNCTLQTGLAIAYRPPQSLGADRIANAAGAYRLYGGPCITVDFGTATTFGVVTKDGTFLGGAIAPGMQSSADALVSRAAQLHRFDFVKPQKAVADNTQDALRAGLMYGFSGLAENIICKIKQEIGEARVIATGGLADVIAGDIQNIDIVDKFLTLKGLQIIYEKNA